MVEKKRLLAVIIIVVLVASGAFYFFQSEENKVIRRINLLADKVSKEGTEPAVIMAQRVSKIAEIFADICDIESDRHNLFRQYRRDEIRSYVASARARFQSLSLDFLDIQVEFPSKNLATARLTGMFSGINKSGEIFDETIELEMELVKVDSEWFIRRIKAVEVLER